MAILTFPSLFAQAASAVQSTADALRYLKNTSGDLPMYNLFAVWQSMQQANAIVTPLLVAAAADPTAAQNALPSFGGAPATVADLQTGFVNIQTASTAFNAATTAWVAANLTAPDLLAIQSLTLNGTSSSVLTWADHIPQAKIDPLRAEPSLATLIAAFEAIGATA